MTQNELNQEPQNFDELFNLPIPIQEQNSYQISKLNPQLLELDETFRQILKDGHLPECIAIIEKMDLMLKEYKETTRLWEKILLPIPQRILSEIKKNFQLNLATAPLLKFLYISWRYSFAKIIYPCSIVLLILTLLALFGLGWSLNLLKIKVIFLLLLIISISVQVSLFEDIVKNILFTRSKDNIFQVIKNLHQENLNFAGKVLAIPTRLEDINIDTEFDTIKGKLDLKKQEKLEKIELEKHQRLHNLGASVAIANATKDKDVKEILANSELDIEARRLDIHDLAKERDRAHEIALEQAKAEGKALVEEKKLLVELVGEDNQRVKDIDYQIKLMEGLMKTIRMQGQQALTDPHTKEVIEKLIEMFSKSKKDQD